MRSVTHCARCEYNPAPEDVEMQGDGPRSEPQQGDYWLCKICGFVHVYRQAFEVTGTSPETPILVTFPPTTFELLDAMAKLPEMFEERNRILLDRLSIQRGGRPS